MWIIKHTIKNLICGLQLPREAHRLTGLLQPIGRWQYDGIVWLILRSVKSINVDFLKHIHFYYYTYYMPALTYGEKDCSFFRKTK